MKFIIAYFRRIKTGHWLITGATLILLFLFYETNSQVVNVPPPAPQPEKHPFKLASLLPPDSLNQITLVVEKGEPGLFESAFSTIQKRFLALDQDAEIKADKKNNKIIVTTALLVNEMVKKYLTTPGKLQFYESYSVAELAHCLKKADSIYYTLVPESKKQEIRHKKDHPDTSYEKLKKAGARKTGELSDFPEFNNDLHMANGQMNYSVDVGETGFSIAFSDSSILLNTLFPEGLYKYLLPQPMLGSHLEKDTAKIDSLMKLPAIKSVLPKDLLLSWCPFDVEDYSTRKPFKIYLLLAMKGMGLNARQPLLEGDIAKKAWVEKEKKSSFLNIQLNENAAKIWDSLTRTHIERFIVSALDGEVITFQQIKTENKGGLYQIGTNPYSDGLPVSDSTLTYLADIVNAGSLPVKVSIAGITQIKSTRSAFYNKTTLFIFLIVVGATVTLLISRGKRKRSHP